MNALSKTTVDYLKFRTKSDPYSILEFLRSAFGTVGDLLELGEPLKGKDGWVHRRSLILAGDVVLAQIDYGGDSQFDWVRFDMSGAGCKWVQHWHLVVNALEQMNQAELKRVDLALTLADGSISHEKVLEAHSQGLFSAGGRSPKYKEILPSNPRDGRTIYLGSRDGAKFIRAYEKGFETLIKSGLDEAIRNAVIHINYEGLGKVEVDKLYRIEVEFKNIDKVLPYPMLVDRDSFFAGANPYCASLLPLAVARKSQGIPDFGAKIAMAASLENCRKSYGAIIRTALTAYGGDVDKVFGMICADGPSARLIANGVLTCEFN